MKPGTHISSVSMPITFDNIKAAKLVGSKRAILGIFLAICSLGLSVYIAINANHTLPIRLLEAVIVFFFLTLFIRICVLRELYFRKEFLRLKQQGFKCSDSSLWGIYNISEGEVPVCRLIDETQLVFIKMFRGSVVGNGNLGEYNHFECLSDCMAEASRMGLGFVYLNPALGSSGALFLDEAINNLDSCRSDSLKDVLIRVYDNVCKVSQDLILDEDIFVLIGVAKDNTFEQKVWSFADMLLKANYVEYEFLGKEELNSLYASLFNLPQSNIDNFLMRSHFSNRQYLNLIWLETEEGRQVVSLTSQEKEQKERAYKAKKAVSVDNKALRKVKDVYFDTGDSEEVSDADNIVSGRVDSADLQESDPVSENVQDITFDF